MKPGQSSYVGSPVLLSHRILREFGLRPSGSKRCQKGSSVGYRGNKLAILIGVSTFFWFGDITLALLIAAALIINLISSVVAGIFVPLVLRRFEQDPAIAGSVVVTTVTDVVGFVSFLGLATIFLL